MTVTAGAPTAPLAPASWLRLPRRTARLRLTLLYSGLFLLSGTCVLAIVFVLVAQTSVIQAHAAQAVSAVPTPAVIVTPGAARKLVQAGPTPDLGSAIKKNLTAQHTRDVGRLLAASWVVLAISAVASAVLGWIAAGRVLRPLRAITTTARTISAGSLHQRLALTGPNDEFKQLGDTLDDLFGRLEASFNAQRRFIANASHELRTPLTVERTLLQVALADPDATVDSLRSTCEELLTCGEEHERLLEGLLTLATSDRGIDQREPVDLANLAAHALEAARPAITERSLALSASLLPASTIGDPSLVERLIANLIDNASSHNVDGGTLELTTAATDVGAATVRVSNTGPLIAPEQVDRLFEPFQRLGGRSSEANGHFGLGLSIVRAIATAHAATVAAHPRPGGGLEVTVRFPAPDPQGNP